MTDSACHLSLPSPVIILLLNKYINPNVTSPAAHIGKNTVPRAIAHSILLSAGLKKVILKNIAVPNARRLVENFTLFLNNVFNMSASYAESL
jgi:hypothetical protein